MYRFLMVRLFSMWALLGFLGYAAAVPSVVAGDLRAGRAVIQLATEGPSAFEMAGRSQHMGRFECCGEIHFQPVAADGILTGEGVAVVEAANGDRIVGVVSCRVDADGLGDVHFSWRDAVEFSDGTVVRNTGRFARRRPPGVVIAIIAILIG